MGALIYAPCDKPVNKKAIYTAVMPMESKEGMGRVQDSLITSKLVTADKVDPKRSKVRIKTKRRRSRAINRSGRYRK